MATVPRPRRPTEPRSGGKMVRPKVRPGSRTPYDRSPSVLLPDSSESQNPNWLSRLILSPTRMIANGAGKVLTSVFGPESPSSSSSSSDDSDDDRDDIDNDNEISSQGANNIIKVIEWKSETKRAIERLLMQETFSREECDRLTHIIKSRVVDSPMVRGTEDGRLTEIHHRTIDSDADIPDLRSTAVTEAKKWLEEKKLGSSPKLELEYGICTLNTASSPHATEDETGGSPADLAKSYMRARPPWASPSADHIQFRSPSPIGLQLFKEEPPYSFGGNSVSSRKLSRSPATGSWSIQDEIRKVRSRATEEMLRTRPSAKVDWSSLASDYRRSHYSLVFDKNEAAIEDKMCNSAQAIDTSLTLVSGVTTCGQDGLQNEASPSNLATSVPEQCQELEAMLVTERKQDDILSLGQSLHQPSQEVKAVLQKSTSDASMADNLKDADGTNQQLSSMARGTTQDTNPDSRLQEVYCSKLEEVVGNGGAIAANGFTYSGSRLPAGWEVEPKGRPSDKEHSLIGSGNENVTISVTVEETCNVLSEGCVEVPIVEVPIMPLVDMPITNENADEANVSQNSSSAHLDVVTEDITKPSSKRKATSFSEKQEGRKLSRYNRRGRGRGK